MSEIRATTISDAAGTGPVTLTKQSAAKVWCTVDQTGTMELKDSFGVTSVTDDGTGRSDLSFTNDFSNQHYAVATSSEQGGSFNDIRVTNRDSTQVRAVGQFEFYNINGLSSSADDADYVNVIIQGDLA